jgi:UDP-N-acetylmuramoylalanine--D-glutamate ligase
MGGSAAIFDSSPAGSLAKPELVAEAERLGLPVEFGWEGRLPEGFSSIVVNPAVDPRSEVFAGLVGSGLPIWSEIEFAYRIAAAPIVAVTGTNGKSTTTVLTFLALEACGAKPVLCGNIFGSGYPETTLTEAALTASGDQVLVAEVSSFQLEQVEAFRPVAAAITQIEPDHQDRYDRYEDYVAAKHRVFAAQGAADTAVIPADGSVATPAGPRVLRFGLGAGDARICGSEMVILGARAELSSLPFGEPHNRMNAMTAGLLAAGYLGRDGGALAVPEAVFEGFRRFRGLAHRMELVGEWGGIRLINNSMCTNPAAVIASAGSVSGGLRLLIGGVNKGLDFRSVGEFVAAQGASTYLYGRDRTEINREMGGGWPEFATMEAAFSAALSNVKPGDTVLLAPGCASLDQFRDFRERGDVFRALAERWLESQP